jgi:hypothetical protein
MGSAFDASLLRDLPAAENPFAVLETLQPALISDRFVNAGLDTGHAPRIGGFLGSWSQTLYRIGDVDVTDPTGSGSPLLFPDLAPWQRIAVATGLFPADSNTTGLAVTFEPKRPTPAWTGEAYGALSHFGGGREAASPPPISTLDGWDRAAFQTAGPIVRERLSLAAAGSWTRSTQFERAERATVSGALASAFADLRFTPTSADEIAGTLWIQRAEHPFEYRGAFGQPAAVTTDTAALIAARWDRQLAAGLSWRAVSSFARRRRSPDFDRFAEVRLERLTDGLPSSLAWTGTSTVRQWSAGARLSGRTATLGPIPHQPSLGADVQRSTAATTDVFDGIAAESVDGHPARIWTFLAPDAGSRRHRQTLAVHAADRLTFGARLEVTAGLRFESVSASARGGANGIEWRSWMPRVHGRWSLLRWWQTTLLAGYTRSTYRLPLDLLAIGDPGASTSTVFRWNPPTSAAAPLAPTGPLVARFGPGSGGDPSFSRIDPELERPHADEIVLGFAVHPRPSLMLALTGVARREQDLLGLVNVGVPDAAYSRFEVADPGADVGSPADDKIVTVYDRLPATFGQDAYVLTNPAQEAATFNGLELTFRHEGRRFVLIGGATASIARASAVSRGFGPLENDQAGAGELFVNPNAGTMARGRLFSDRAYTVKLASLYTFPRDVRLGLLARYQDGQPFARMLVWPDLNQGAEIVRAFPNGDSRFTYTATLDARLQKGFAMGGVRLNLFADAYNVLNLAKEVEEDTTAPPDVRITTAVQPPRAVHVGLRVAF